jgi:hypothetical protein
MGAAETGGRLLHPDRAGDTTVARFRTEEPVTVNRPFRWTPLLPALITLVPACALNLDGKDRCRSDEDCPTRICVQERCAVERPPPPDAGEVDAPVVVVAVVADAGELDAPEVDAPEVDAPEVDAPEVDVAAVPDALCNPAQPPSCAGDGFDVCGGDGSPEHTSCEGRGCLAGSCCPPGQEVVASACRPCGNDGQPCCHPGGTCRCAPGLAECSQLCLAVPATVCVRKTLDDNFFAATFCELREAERRFDCDSEKTRACGPDPDNINILVYAEYHPAATGRAQPEPRYWCCPGCRVATEDEVAGAETCQKEKRKPCAR